MIDYDYENKPYYSHRLWLKSHKNIPSQYQSHPPPTMASRPHPPWLHGDLAIPAVQALEARAQGVDLLSEDLAWRPGFPGTGNRGGLVVCWFLGTIWHPNMPMTWAWGWGIGLPSGAGYRILTASVRIACPAIIVAKLDIFHSSSILGPFGYASQCR